MAVVTEEAVEMGVVVVANAAISQNIVGPTGPVHTRVAIVALKLMVTSQPQPLRTNKMVPQEIAPDNRGRSR